MIERPGAPEDRWAFTGRGVDVVAALGFDAVPEEARVAVATVVGDLRAQDGVVWDEYFSSKQEMDRILLGAPSEEEGRSEPSRDRSREFEQNFGVYNVYVNVSRLKLTWKDALIALAVAAVTAGNPAPIAATLAFKAVGALQVLPEDEAELVHVILKESRGTATSRRCPRRRSRAPTRTRPSRSTG